MLNFIVAYMNDKGEYWEVNHSVETEEDRMRFTKLIRWACHKGVELRVRPFSQTATQNQPAMRHSA